MSKVVVIPDVLESEVEKIEKKIVRLKGLSKRLHIDIIDGLYADNITVSVGDVREVEFGEIAVEIHLMVDDVMEYVEECVELKPARVIAQIERMGSQTDYVEMVGKSGVGVGLAVDLYTPVSSLEKEALEQVEVVLLMSVKAGESGQKFDERVIEKIKELRSYYEGEIMVDGGMNPETAKIVGEAGASEVAVNSYLWNGEIRDKLKEFE